MKKKYSFKFIISYTLIAFIIGGSVVSGADIKEAQPTKTGTENDSKVIALAEEPVIINNQMMVPVRAIAEAMGWSVDANQYAIYLKKHGTTELIPEWLYYTYYQSVICLTDDDLSIKHYDTLGGINMYHFHFGHYPSESGEGCPGEKTCRELNTAAIELVAKPVLVKGRMFVTMADLAEALYADIEWDASTRAITVTSHLPYYDGNGLPPGYRESLLQKTLSEYTTARATPILENLSFDLIAFEAEVFRLTNEARKNEGLQPLTTIAEVDMAVRIRADELLVTYSHTRPDGSRCSTAFIDLPYSYNNENIAYNLIGTSPEETAAGVVSIWMGSSGHRAAILNPKSRYIGVAASLGPNGRIYCAQVFMR